MTLILFFANMCNIDTLVQFDHTEIKCVKLELSSTFNFQLVTFFDKFALLPSTG